MIIRLIRALTDESGNVDQMTMIGLFVSLSNTIVRKVGARWTLEASPVMRDWHAHHTRYTSLGLGLVPFTDRHEQHTRDCDCDYFPFNCFHISLKYNQPTLFAIPRTTSLSCQTEPSIQLPNLATPISQLPPCLPHEPSPNAGSRVNRAAAADTVMKPLVLHHRLRRHHTHTGLVPSLYRLRLRRWLLHRRHR